KRLLANPAMPVADVAVAVGFSDPSYFTRVFKRQEGVAPSEYRAAVIFEAARLRSATGREHPSIALPAHKHKKDLPTNKTLPATSVAILALLMKRPGELPIEERTIALEHRGTVQTATLTCTGFQQLSRSSCWALW